MNSKPEYRNTLQGVTVDFTTALDLRRFLIWRLFLLLLLLPSFALAAEPDPRLAQIEQLRAAQEAAQQAAEQLQAAIEADAQKKAEPAPIPIPANEWPEQMAVERGRVLILGTEPDATKVSWILRVLPDGTLPVRWGELKSMTFSGTPILVVETLDTSGFFVSVKYVTGEGDSLREVHTGTYVEVTGNAPDPPPPPPNKAEYGMIIEQRSDRGGLTPQQGFIFDSQRIEDLFPPGHWRTIDLDKLGPDNTPPDEDIPLINRAKELGRLPVLWLWDKDEKLIVEKYGKDFPADVDATIDLIRERK